MRSSLRSQVRRSLKIVLIEGCFYYLMVGFGERYFAPFALWLGATPLQIGLLTTLPLFLGAVSQIFSPQLIAFFGSRKKFIVAFVFLQACVHFPMLASPLLRGSVWFFIFAVSLYQIAILIHIPAWNSWLADLVSESDRGEYFGFHKRVTQIVIFIATVASGPFLIWMIGSSGSRFGGFAALFVIAALARISSGFLMTRIAEPPLDMTGFEKISYAKELKKVNHNHLSQLVTIIAITSFGAYVAVPFFTPYMLDKLGWDYNKYALSTAVVLASRFVFSPVWGHLCDRFGCRSIMLITTTGIAAVPLLWFVSDNFWVLCAAQVLSGLCWSGYELSWFNFMLDSTSRSNRAQFFSLQQVLSNLAMVLGSLVGGAIITLTDNTKYSYHYVFLVSAAMRYMASLSVLFFIREIRTVERVRYRDFAYVFFKAVKDRGMFYVPDVLKTRSSREET